MLYLLHVADMPDIVGVKANENSGNANDTAIWAVRRSVAEVVQKLNALAQNFANYAKGNGLVLNALKTQLLFSLSAGNVEGTTLEVDGALITPSATFELLGVTFNRKFTTAPHVDKVAAATEQRASVIKRMSYHLRPREQYMRTLSLGLVHGKLSHALAAVATLRLSDTVTIPEADRKI
jgi:hypothetical protein